MAMIKCPECGADISDKATACPHCGAPPAAPEHDKEIAQAKRELQEGIAAGANLFQFGRKLMASGFFVIAAGFAAVFVIALFEGDFVPAAVFGIIMLLAFGLATVIWPKTRFVVSDT